MSEAKAGKLEYRKLASAFYVYFTSRTPNPELLAAYQRVFEQYPFEFARNTAKMLKDRHDLERVPSPKDLAAMLKEESTVQVNAIRRDYLSYPLDSFWDTIRVGASMGDIQRYSLKSPETIQRILTSIEKVFACGHMPEDNNDHWPHGLEPTRDWLKQKRRWGMVLCMRLLGESVAEVGEEMALNEFIKKANGAGAVTRFLPRLRDALVALCCEAS